MRLIKTNVTHVLSRHFDYAAVHQLVLHDVIHVTGGLRRAETWGLTTKGLCSVHACLTNSHPSNNQIKLQTALGDLEQNR